MCESCPWKSFLLVEFKQLSNCYSRGSVPELGGDPMSRNDIELRLFASFNSNMAGCGNVQPT